MGSYGLADTEKHIPISAETRYAIGSISKQFAAVAVLQLSDQGKLSLDDALAKYLPTIPNADRITLRMLLNQTSGLHNYPNTSEHDWPNHGSIPTARLIAIMAQDKPDFPPGTRFEYSNTNYFALAAVVTQVSGEPFSDYLHQHIFELLGMAGSGDGFASQHGLAIPVGGQGDPHHPNSLDLYQGAGSVVSTAGDLLRWDQALLDRRLLKPESMRLLWSAGQPATGTSTYAMGFVTASISGHREVWHNGLTPTAGGYNLNAIFPDDRLAIVVLSNGPDFQPEPEKLVKMVALRFLGESAIQGSGGPEDPAVTALARKVYTQMRAGGVDPALLSPQMASLLTSDALTKQKPVFDQLGDPTKLTLESRSTSAQGITWRYLADFPAAQLHVTISIGQDGKVAGYLLQP